MVTMGRAAVSTVAPPLSPSPPRQGSTPLPHFLCSPGKLWPLGPVTSDLCLSWTHLWGSLGSSSGSLGPIP